MSKAVKDKGDSPKTMLRPSVESANAGTSSFEAILAQPSRVTKATPPAAERMSAIVIGTLRRVSEAGMPEVEFPGSPTGRPIAAVTTGRIDAADVGRDVALSFVEGDPGRPLILGFIHHSRADVVDRDEVSVRLDGQTLTLTAREEVVLQCGKASITLTRAGKIIIKGAYLSSRSSGVNRIKGGSVQIN